jgi:hypothetical protein
MPVNGFTAGKWVWVEIISGSMRADFHGVIGHVAETPGENYHVEFRGGFSLSFTRTDLEAGRVVCHEMDHSPPLGRRKTDA